MKDLVKIYKDSILFIKIFKKNGLNPEDFGFKLWWGGETYDTCYFGGEDPNKMKYTK